MPKLPKPVIALGLDPGKENFGWGLIAARSLEDYVMLDEGILHCVSSQYSEVRPEFIGTVVDDVLAKVVLGDVEYVIIERYHPRGGTLVGVEYVNVMIGAILCALSSLDVTIYTPTAGAWKPTVYSQQGWTHLDWFPGASVIHAADAGCMSLSMLYRNGIIPWDHTDPEEAAS